MQKAKDYLYVIFMGLILFIAGAIILGGTSYLISTFIGFDFISIVLYFVLCVYLSKLVMRGVRIYRKAFSVIIPLYAAIMYIIKDYVAFFIIYAVSGTAIKDLFLSIPYIMLLNIVNTFSFPSSLDGILNYILGIIFFIIEILIMVAGVYRSYRITKLY